MLLNKVMPTWHFSSGRHTVAVKASPEHVYTAIMVLQAKDIPLFRELFWLRSLPKHLTGQGRGYFHDDDVPILEQAVHRLGFLKLTEQRHEELVFGAVGKWWLPLGAEFYTLKDGQAFVTFDLPGYVKTAANFTLTEGKLEGVTTLEHETRVYATDRIARRKFAGYWILVYPGVLLLRRMWLRAIKRKAEALAELSHSGGVLEDYWEFNK